MGLVLPASAVAQAPQKPKPPAAAPAKLDSQAAWNEVIAAEALIKQGNWAAAEARLTALKPRFSRDLPNDPAPLAGVLVLTSHILTELGRPKEAIAPGLEALNPAKTRLSAAPRWTVLASLVLSAAYAGTDQFGKAREMAGQASAVNSQAKESDEGDASYIAAALGRVALASGNFPLAREVLDKGLAHAGRIADPQDRAITLAYVGFLRGRTAALAGDDAAALRFYAEALGGMEAAGLAQHPYAAFALDKSAAVLARTGRLKEAAAVGRKASADLAAQFPNGHPALATSLNNLAEALRQAGEYQEAFNIGYQALRMRLALHGEVSPEVAESFNNLGLVAFQGGQEDVAENSLRKAVALRRALKDEAALARPLKNLAAVLMMRGKLPEGPAVLREAKAVYDRNFPLGNRERATVAAELASALLSEGKPEEALAAARESRAALAAATRDVAMSSAGVTLSDIERRYLLRSHADAALAVARIRPAEAQALLAEAFASAQDAQLGAAAAALSQAGTRFAAGSDALAGLVRERQETADSLRRLESLLAGARAEGLDIPVATLRTSFEATARQRDQLDAEIAKRFPHFAALATPQPVPLKDAQARLGADEALLVLLPGMADTLVFVVTREGAVWHRAPLGVLALAKEVALLRRALDPTAPSRGAESAFDEAETPASAPSGGPDYDLARANRLYAALLGPVETVLKAKPHWLVVADGPLSSLPFAVLTTGPSAPQADAAATYRAALWLARRHAVTTLPSVGSLTVRRDENVVSAAAPDLFRGFGNPTLGGAGAAGATSASAPAKVAARAASPGAYFDRGLADVEAVRALAPLPNTETELQALAVTLKAPKSSLIMGTKATETAVKTANLSRTQVLAFATHALVAGELKGFAEPALVFTPPATASLEDDGLLTASEAARLRLSAEWVVLSACNTAAGDGQPGAEGLSGLARAFLFAGARALLASHWPVRDDAAAKITTATFALRGKEPDLGRAEALRRAMMGVLDDPADPTLAHPSAWAPFVVVGEGGK